MKKNNKKYILLFKKNLKINRKSIIIGGKL